MAKKDIYILNQVSGIFPNGQFEFSFGDQVLSIEGIQKLINTFLLYFLTAQGTELGDSTFGTILGTVIGGNLIPIVRSKIRVDLARTVLAVQDITDIPDDEALESLQILDITFARDTVDLSLKFTSKAGESVEIKFPMRVA